MGFSLRCGKIAGVPIKVHWSVLAVVVFVAGSLAMVGFPRVDPDAGLTSRIVWGLAAAVVFLLSILGHELGHALAARRHEIGTDEINLWLLGGIARLSKQAETAKAEFQIAFAGPLASALIGAGLIGLARMLHDEDGYGLAGTVFLLVGAMNLVLAISNLLPGAPLDGGRVLTAILWHRTGEPEKSRLTSARVGIILGAIIFVAGIAEVVIWDRQTGWATAATAVFIGLAAKGEIAGAVIRQRLRDRSVDAVMAHYPPPISDTTTAHQWLASMPDGLLRTAVPVVRWSREPIGYCSPVAAMSVPADERSFVSVGDLMVPESKVARAWSSEPIATVLQRSGGDFERFGVDGFVVVHDAKTRRPVGTASDLQLHPLFAPPDFWGRADAIRWRARVSRWIPEQTS